MPNGQLSGESAGTAGRRYVVLAAAFLAWMFAGLEISLFVLIHRQAMLDLRGVPGPPQGIVGGSFVAHLTAAAEERVVTQWFAWYQCAFLFGAAAGGWLFGWLGDRVGRTRSMALSVLCYSLLTGLCYFADTPEELLVLRFLACLGIGGVWPNAVALVAEAWPDASRPFLAGLLGAAANVGFVLLGVIGYYQEITPDSWRWVLLVGAAPVVLGIFCLLAVPESARWRAAHSAPRAKGAAGPLREVLRPPLLQRTVIGVCLGAIPVVGTAANGNWLTPWTDHVAQQQAQASGQPAKAKASARSKATTQITRSGGAVFGSLLGGAIASLLGRRLTYFLISLFAFATSSYIFGRLDPLHPQFHLFVFLLGFVGVTYFGWLPLFLPELFPTRVRSTGTGISFNTGRVLAAFVVLGAGVLIAEFDSDYAAVGFWSGMIYVAGMAVIWFAPRTKDRLED